MTTTTPKRPTHRAYAVTKNGDKSYWREIGGVWQHEDGKGFNLRLDYLPLNGAEIVIREPRNEAAAEAGERGAQ
jgi:hypothetical protein